MEQTENGFRYCANMNEEQQGTEKTACIKHALSSFCEKELTIFSKLTMLSMNVLLPSCVNVISVKK